MPFSTWLFFASNSLLNSSAGFIVNQIGALVVINSEVVAITGLGLFGINEVIKLPLALRVVARNLHHVLGVLAG